MSCSPAILGFESAFTLNGGSYGYHTFTLSDTGCSVSLTGCTDPMAFNYVQGSTAEDGSCRSSRPFYNRTDHIHIFMENPGHKRSGVNL